MRRRRSLAAIAAPAGFLLAVHAAGCALPGAIPDSQGAAGMIAPGDFHGLAEAARFSASPMNSRAGLERAAAYAQAAVELRKDAAEPALWGAQACFWLAATAGNTAEQVRHATLGMAILDPVLAHWSQSAALHYWYAANLGLWIQSQGLGGMSRFEEVIEQTQAALGLDPSVDQGGPLRIMGAIRLRAPAWPIGAGDIDLALELLERAVREYPSHPENHLFYAEAALADNRPKLARKHVERARGLALAPYWGIMGGKWLEDAAALARQIEEREAVRHF